MPAQTCYSFGPFRLDAASGLLFRDNELLALPPKAIETLRILLDNAGRTVHRGELMAKVWPDTFVEEANLTVTISLLRKTLGDNRDEPQFIATVPKRGYRFVAPVVVEAIPSVTKARTTSLWVGAACIVLLIGAMAFWPRPMTPRSLRAVQLTHTGLVEPIIATDGVRIYFMQRKGAQWGLYQVPVEGGEPVAISTPFTNTALYDLS